MNFLVGRPLSNFVCHEFMMHTDLIIIKEFKFWLQFFLNVEILLFSRHRKAKFQKRLIHNDSRNSIYLSQNHGSFALQEGWKSA